MKRFTSLEAAYAAAHPGTYIAASMSEPDWAVMSLGEMSRATPSEWVIVARARPFHRVVDEAETGWHHDDIGKPVSGAL